jgi:hypothetical protein
VAPRFSRPRLTSADDKQYRAFLAQIMIGKDNQRAIRPPRARDLFGGEAEAALRDWLAQHLTLSDRRIVEYLEHRGRSAIKKYRELDAVSIPDPKTLQVFEIKASQKATSLRRAAQQLRDTRSILGILYPRVYATILLVDTGIPNAEEVTELMAAEDAPPVAPPTLDEVLATLPHVQRIDTLDQRDADPSTIGLLRFGVDDIIALAGAEHLHLDWDEDEDEAAGDLEAEREKPRYAYTTDEPASEDQQADEDNPLAAALRRAMQGRSDDTMTR